MNVDLKKGIVEYVGTFFFLLVILTTLYDNTLGPIAVAVALLAVLYFSVKISGGHINPVVSLSMFLKGKLSYSLLILYILCQVLGGITAVLLTNYLYK